MIVIFIADWEIIKLEKAIIRASLGRIKAQKGSVGDGCGIGGIEKGELG